MTIEECYQEMGGNFADVSTRLPSSRLIEKFIVKFLEDDSFDTLCSEMKAGNRKEAFMAAHTLKGVCANMGFTRLLDSVARLTEVLRPETSTISDMAEPMMEDVRFDYRATVAAIHQYIEKA